MTVVLVVRKPGPTDLSWEDQNPVDYIYRPSDLPNLKQASRRRPAERAAGRTREAKTARRTKS